MHRLAEVRRCINAPILIGSGITADNARDYADAEPVRSDWEHAYSVHPGGGWAQVGPFVFAGEHTAGDWHALMEGALRSGERAAADVMRRAAPSSAG